MATVTMHGNDNVAIEKTPRLMVFDVDFSADDTTTTATLRVLPAGCVVLDAFMCCTTAEVGGTSADVDMKVGSTEWWTGTADNGGVINVYDYAAAKYCYVVPDTTVALRTLAVTWTEAGTSTAGPVMRVGVLVYRPDF